jgi:hypothetical protein
MVIIRIRKRVLVLHIRITGKKNLENISAAYLMVSVKVSAPMATPTGDNAKTKKEKAMEQSTLPAMV